MPRSSAALVEAIRAIGLLSPEQQEVAAQLAASLPERQALVGELVSRGWITEYQKGELLRRREHWLVVGPYIKLEPKGMGGMGQVFRAWDRDNNRVVALKLIRHDYLDNEQVIARFLHEGQAARGLSHPNIVAVYDAGRFEDTLFLAMEFLSGTNLCEYVKQQQQRKLSVAEACDYIMQAALGLQYAHERGLVHRDIKPGNLMRTDEGQIKILDFGVALMADASRITESCDLLGTIDYISPEQATDSRHVDIRTDIYSLGCTFYHLLAGQVPFAGTHPAVRALRRITHDPPPISDLSRPLALVLVRMLARDPDDRFQTPGELAEALVPFVQSGPTSQSEALIQGQLPENGETPPTAAPLSLVGSRRADLPREIVNSIGMKFVLIPAGTFLMGSPEGEEGHSTDEGPQHEVEITRPFYLGVYPVTQAQWRALMGNTPSYFCASGGGEDEVRGMDTDDSPVEQVSWEDVAAFLNALASLEEERERGRKYRLPTEAEWEYSCRGGARSYSAFHFGISLSSTEANFDGNHPHGGAARGPYLERTCMVGSYRPNGFGLYDMHGNVFEWCADWYDADYYHRSPEYDPPGPAEGSGRVIRGGCWGISGSFCRSASRYRYAPGSRRSIVGFRAALVLPAEQ
jgi:formylglycine-generating enzyme required for sulfatase activity/tRNA A-37 threonylcarbamoyl transferase component Bud32